MNKIITRAAGVVGALALGIGGLSLMAPDASAASKVGTATVKEGRKVVREADKQKCLTRTEVRRYVHGTGTQYEPGYYAWAGKGKAEVLVVHFNGACADQALLGYDNGDAYAWIDGSVLWADA